MTDSLHSISPDGPEIAANFGECVLLGEMTLEADLSSRWPEGDERCRVLRWLCSKVESLISLVAPSRKCASYVVPPNCLIYNRILYNRLIS